MTRAVSLDSFSTSPSVACPIFGSTLQTADDCHIDHVGPVWHHGVCHYCSGSSSLAATLKQPIIILFGSTADMAPSPIYPPPHSASMPGDTPPQYQYDAGYINIVLATKTLTELQTCVIHNRWLQAIYSRNNLHLTDPLLIWLILANAWHISVSHKNWATLEMTGHQRTLRSAISLAPVFVFKRRPTQQLDLIS